MTANEHMLRSAAHHLHFADQVVVLEKGGRVTQNLPAQDFLSISRELHSDDDSEAPQPSNSAQEPFDVTLSDLGIPANEEEAAAASRQTGDFKAYTFYSRIAGWKTASTYLLLNAIFMFGLNFPCASFFDHADALY